MTREKLIEQTTDMLLKLSDENLREVADFAELLLNKTEEKDWAAGIRQIAADSNSFKFLEDEEDLYSIKDLKEVYR
jgi:hypothetical protein